MDQIEKKDLMKAFLIFKNTVSSTLNDINFYRSFLNNAVDRYHEQQYQPEQIFSSVFSAYNISSDTGDGYSRMHSECEHYVTKELHTSNVAFISSFCNMALLKLYNALEVFLFEAIKIRYFPALPKPTGSRNATNTLCQAMKTELISGGIKVDARNNRYLLAFLRNKSKEVDWFLNQKMRIDLHTDYCTFFDLISILRNLIGHHGTIVSADTKNEISSKAKDVFLRHFDLIKDENGYENLQPKVDQFSNFVSFYKELALNTVKFIFGYSDLDIFDMYS